jgi:hypothetical protein
LVFFEPREEANLLSRIVEILLTGGLIYASRLASA